ncbi:exo-beta-N-acetylmuramidase NamZ family protein [Rosettibacter firmus]|uniref:exo-beta-N-acetylmuramidase NamZ family protein n=1 Tax=Rosettibacter firmus TaxID=3111522 RepID=UPI00336C2706
MKIIYTHLKLIIIILIYSSTLLSQSKKVLLGIDVLEKENYSILTGKNVGLIANHTSVNSKLISTYDLFKNAKNFKLVAVFSPEHGFKGISRSGELIDDYIDTTTGIKFYSLYGKTLKPTPEMLKGIDVLVYDIQDIGCRSYTYISTLGLAMEAAAENNIEFVVLDRPNPLGGLRIEGNIVEDNFISFVSKFKIPYVYGLTCGELALLLNEEKMLSNGLKCKLLVVKMEGWKRWMKFDDTGLIWIPTSANVPDSKTPFYLVATGILGELNEISIGISYTLPFQTLAAEWINADTLAKYMNALNLDGVIFRPISYKPLYGKWQNKILNGVQIHIYDFNKVKLIPIQFYFLETIAKLYPEKKIFNIVDTTRINMFDKVLGTDKIRLEFSRRYKVDDIISILNKDINNFKILSKKYHLYK